VQRKSAAVAHVKTFDRLTTSIFKEAQPVRIDQDCSCVDRTELVLGSGIPEVLSMLLLMNRVKVGHQLSFRAH
jgi:hypothetical protein